MKSEVFLQQLKEQGFRITKVRRWLVWFFGISDLPMTVLDLQAKLSENEISANKTTLYRELEFLAEQNLVTQITLRDGRIAYESALGHHHHLVCTSCSRILHVDVEQLEVEISEAQKWLVSQSGFSTVTHTLEFEGVCSDCRRG